MRLSAKVHVFIGSLLVLVLCASCGRPPDWKALYSHHLGQPVIQIDESYLNRSFTGERGSLTRVAWAQVNTGELILLGLPAYEVGDAQEVVNRTVVLRQNEWTQACGNALGQDAVSATSVGHDHPGNAIRAEINNLADTWCEFYYTPEGWELRVVRVAGRLKSAIRP